MKAMACATAVLMFALSTACKDRDDRDTANRVDNAAEDLGDAAKDAGNSVEEAGKDVGDAASDAAKDVKNEALEATDNVDGSYDSRDEFRSAVKERLARLDAELSELGRDAKAGANQARTDAVAAAQEARQAAGRTADRLATATRATWEESKRAVNESLDAAERQVQALRSDAKPMGGTGGPS